MAQTTMSQMQMTPWPQQQCGLAMVVPVEHFQGNLPPGAMLVPAEQFQSSFQGPLFFPSQQLQGPSQHAHCNMPAGAMYLPTVQLQGNFQAPLFVPAEQFHGNLQGNGPQAMFEPQGQAALMCRQVRQESAIEPEIKHCNVDSTGHPPTTGVADDSTEVTTQGSWSDWDQSSDQDKAASVNQLRLTTSAARRLRRKRAAERSTSEHGKLGPLVAGPRYQAAKNFRPEFYNDLHFKLSEGGRTGAESALAAIRGQVWDISQDPLGCRLVQLALERVSQQEAAELARELHGHVQEAATSPHANYVLQKVISQLTFNSARFVAEELVGSCARIARHRFGCRILCRLMEFFGSQSLVLQLIDELLREAEDLCSHCFAHHVVQSVLEHSDEPCRGRVAAALLSDPLAYAQHKNASYLIERALCYCCQSDRQALLAHLSDPDQIADLAVKQYGRYVARALLQQKEVNVQATLEKIKSRIPQLQKTKHGQHLMIELGLPTAKS